MKLEIGNWKLEIFKKWPTKNQWRQFFKILSPKEKFIFFAFLLLFVGSFLFLSINFYFKNTEIVPAIGGIYIEGRVGGPRFINPLYAATSDVDRDLTELIYSGLMKYDLAGKIVPDLAEKYQILEDGKIYEFYLKENLVWSDGKPLSADDVIFTIKAIQNPDSKSPLRASWLGVEIEKISNLGVRFKLKHPSAVFLENCTLKIIPKHIWENISPKNFPLAIYNLKPIGSGPYQLKNLSQDPQGNITSLELVRNPKYFGKSPYLSSIHFKFFKQEEDLISAFQKGEIKGFTLTSIKNLTRKDLVKLNDSFNLYSFSLPRYFAVFFNPEEAELLKDKKIRTALNYGTNKEEIVEKVLFGKGKVVHSPILPKIYGFKVPSKIYPFNLEKAKQLLEEAGFKEKENGFREKIVKKIPTFQFKSNLQFGSRGIEVKELQRCLARDPEVYPEGTVSGYFGPKTKRAVIKFQEKYKDEILTPVGLSKGTGKVRAMTRKKLNEVCFESREEVFLLKFSLITVEQPILIEVAKLLKEQWAKIGVEIEIKTFNSTTLEREIIKPRNYQMLLFGEVLGTIPDPYPFWHSSQRKDPGLNLANWRNQKADKLLKEARQSLIESERKEKLEIFQEILIEDAPCIFLYNPDFLYFVQKEIKGIKTGMITDPSQRFNEIENWYIKTKRAWK